MDSPTSSTASGKFGGSVKRTQCPACQKAVYEVEKVKASDGRIFHSRCLKCAHCGCILKGNYHSVEGNFYCTIAHFRAHYPTGAGAPPSRSNSTTVGPVTSSSSSSRRSVDATSAAIISALNSSTKPKTTDIVASPAGSGSNIRGRSGTGGTGSPASASPSGPVSSNSPTQRLPESSTTKNIDPQLAAAAAGASMLLVSEKDRGEKDKPKLETRSSELDRLRAIDKQMEETEQKSKGGRKGSKIVPAPQADVSATAPTQSQQSQAASSTSSTTAAGSTAPLSTSSGTVPPLNSQQLTSSGSYDKELEHLREEKRRLDSARRHFDEERQEFERRVQAESQRLLKEQQQLQNVRNQREAEPQQKPDPPPSGSQTDRPSSGVPPPPSAGMVESPSLPNLGADEDDVKRLYLVRQETKRKLETREMRIEKLRRKLERLRDQRREYRNAASSLQGALVEERATVDGMVKLTEKLQEEIQVLENERLSLMRELRSTKDEYEELLVTVVKSAKDAIESKSKNKKLVGTWKILEMNNRMQAQQQLQNQPPGTPISLPLNNGPLHSTGSNISGSPSSTRSTTRALTVADEETLSISLWSRYPKLPDKWAGQARIFDNRIQSLSLLSLPDGYNYEFGNPDIIGFDTVHFEYEDYFIPFYRRYFFEKEHSNYVGMNESGAVIISIEKGDSRLKTIIWKAEDHERLVLPKGKDKLKSIFLLHPELQGFKFTQVTRSKFPAELLEYEQKMLITKYKFGVLYVAPGQKTENEWYNNSVSSPQFEEFLEFLGDKIELEGWTKFRGGLHTANQRTGKYSYYTQFHDLEIMYHVSTLLPPVTYDSQQLERKRHLGNDIVLIVFRDAECTDPFDPSQIMSQFNHVFVVVQADKSDPQAGTRYKLAIASKKGVGPYGPVLPEFGVYRKTPEFREFLLTKLINAECAALLSPSFVGKLRSTRAQYLNRLVEYTLSNGTGNIWTSLGRETMKSLRNQFPGARDLRASAREANRDSPSKEKGPMRTDG